MANRTPIKTTFAPAKVIQPLYTRGSATLSQDGRILASCLDDHVLLSHLPTGEELARIEGVRIPSFVITLPQSDMLTKDYRTEKSQLLCQ